MGRKPKLFNEKKNTFADKNEVEVKYKFKERLPEEILEEGIRLNRYIANSGICSRREADILIIDGIIKINGTIVDTLGYIVKPGDSVKYGNKILSREKMAYVLLNKPKDFLTTTSDPNERGTVMDLVKNACKERIYPVGRLDRATTGLLLLTNDGELTEKLTHPSHNIKKIYQVEINRPISVDDANAILEGVYFEEGKAIVDSMAVLDGDRMTIGIEIHIGWNRIIRRIFEAKGYEVVKLDRMLYAGLTKKDLPRGHWRHLTEKEVVMLKHFS
ncbi:MAG: rRNA pseudouridine synthase [Cytophagales bacterium]|nr:MAG: rRNA pseudouridine synthase [Cytophagales bacterium]